jgi:hypothetical protein
VGTELDFVSLVPLVLHADPLTEIPESFYQNKVVCPSPSMCLARGFRPNFSDATVTVFTDGIPGPPQIIPDTTLRGLTCFSPTSCFAVGSSNGEGVLVPITNGVVGPLQAVPGTTRLSDVTCTSATSCVATGYTGVFLATTAVVVPITGGGAGPPQSVPGVAVLPRVSCPSATSCFATGTTTDNQGVLVPITHGVAGPAQVIAGTDSLVDIACPSPSTCVAISFDGSVVAITDGTAGPAQLISPDVFLSSIACTDASHCVAVGTYIQGESFEGAVVAIADGVAGSYQAVPGMSVLQTVACSTSCVAVGSDPSDNFGAIVPISGGVPGSVQYVDGAGLLWGVACGAERCIAVGGHPSPTVGGFVVIRAAATPTISTLASPSVPAGGLISDSATLAAGFAPTGNVTFTLYGPGDGTCSNALWSTMVPVGALGVSGSGNVKVGAAGTYNWVATYSGDLNNLPVRSQCGSEPVVITPLPDCANATASPNLLWPPNHKFVPIQISGVTSPGGGAVTLSVSSIFQDEPVAGGPDGTGVGTSTPAVRSERDGGGDGRVYHLAFTATNSTGGTCTGTVTVGVPHDQGHNGGPVDQGALFNSTQP